MKRPKIKPEKIQFIVVDSFCGAGGYTEGVESAVDADGDRIAVVIVGINHDEKAIASHKKNHPETIHFIEDIRDETLPLRIQKIVEADAYAFRSGTTRDSGIPQKLCVIGIRSAKKEIHWKQCSTCLRESLVRGTW